MKGKKCVIVLTSGGNASYTRTRSPDSSVAENPTTLGTESLLQAFGPYIDVRFPDECGNAQEESLGSQNHSLAI